MKRSDINALINESISFFNEMNFKLPPWGYWSPEQWKQAGRQIEDLTRLMLGWDLTDFGRNDFFNKGLILFTLRNGDIQNEVNRKGYAEKIMVVREDQETPWHFHWNKTEDIINRGGGNLVLELGGSTRDERLSDQPITVKVDEVPVTVDPKGKVVLTPGESICLETGVYHRFYGETGKGVVLVGEVSSVNDDNSDNRFLEDIGRFPRIEEDVAPSHLLVTDYADYLE